MSRSRSPRRSTTTHGGRARRPASSGGEVTVPGGSTTTTRSTSDAAAPREPARCPGCHDEVRDEALGEAAVCHGCLALYHARCWKARCEACGAGADAAARPRNRTAERTAGAWLDAVRLVNLAWLGTLVIFLVGGMLADRLGLPIWPTGGQPPLLARVLALPCLVLTLPQVVLNFIDACIRTSRRPGAGGWPVALAALGLFTAGLTSFAAWLRWGLRDDGAEPRAT